MTEQEFQELIEWLSRGYPGPDLSIGYNDDADMLQRYRQIVNVLPRSPNVKKWIFRGIMTRDIISALFLPLPQEAEAAVLPSTIYDSEISSLDFSHAEMRSQALGRLRDLLENYNNLQSLSILGKDSFSREPVATIFGSLANKSSLRKLKILNVRLNSDAVNHLCTILALPNIQELNLSGCEIMQGNDLLRLMTAINNSRITKLFLPSFTNEFAADVYKDVALTLADNKSLQELEIRDLNAKSLNHIAKALSKSKTIKSAKFDSCQIGSSADEVAIGFEKYLAVSALQKLVLDSSDYVSPAVSDRILTTLLRSLDLKELRLSNFVFASDEIDFRQALNANSTLRSLTFDDVEFHTRSLSFMIKALIESKSLTSVKFWGGLSAGEDENMLAEIPQENPNILEMQVDSFGENPVSEKIREQCEKNLQQAQSVAAAIRDAWYRGFSRELIEHAITRVAAILSVLDKKTGEYLYDYAERGIFDILKKTVPESDLEVVGSDEREIIKGFISRSKSDPAFVKTGLEIMLEQLKEAEKSRMPKEDLAEFVVDKFQNGKFPHDWNIIEASILSKALVAYLQDPQPNQGAAKRPRLAANQGEKVEKLLRNGVQSHDKYAEIMTKVNKEFGENILPALVQKHAEKESVEEQELQGILNPDASEKLAMPTKRDLTS